MTRYNSAAATLAHAHKMQSTIYSNSFPVQWARYDIRCSVFIVFSIDKLLDQRLIILQYPLYHCTAHTMHKVIHSLFYSPDVTWDALHSVYSIWEKDQYCNFPIATSLRTVHTTKASHFQFNGSYMILDTLHSVSIINKHSRSKVYQYCNTFYTSPLHMYTCQALMHNLQQFIFSSMAQIRLWVLYIQCIILIYL